MSLLGRVSAVLVAEGIPFAAIGAVALAVRGISRSTLDVDLLALDRRCLDGALWRETTASGVGVDVRRGDADDPLAGVVRFTLEGERPVDLVVGRSAWQDELLRRAEPVAILGVTLPVVAAADLVLLKLYAGGPQDAWDVRQLLAGEGALRLVEEVESRLGPLPEAARRLWASLREG